MMATVEAIGIRYLDKLYQHDANLITTPLRKPEQLSQQQNSALSREKLIIFTLKEKTTMPFSRKMDHLN